MLNYSSMLSPQNHSSPENRNVLMCISFQSGKFPNVVEDNQRQDLQLRSEGWLGGE